MSLSPSSSCSTSSDNDEANDVDASTVRSRSSSDSSREKTRDSAHSSARAARLQKLLSLRGVGLATPVGPAFIGAPDTVREDERFLYSLVSNPAVFWSLVSRLEASNAKSLQLHEALHHVPGFREAFLFSGCSGVASRDEVSAAFVGLLSKPVVGNFELHSFFERHVEQPAAERKEKRQQPRPRRRVHVVSDGEHDVPNKKKNTSGSLMMSSVASWEHHMQALARASGRSVEELRNETRSQQMHSETQSFLQRVDEVEYRDHLRLSALAEESQLRAQQRKREREP